MKQEGAIVISNGEVVPGVHLVWLKASQIVSEAKPGQFVMVRCGGDSLLPRPLSIHQCDGDKIALLFNVVGRGTEWLSRRQTGDTTGMFGPLGNGFSLSPDSKNLLLVAGGMGIAPLYFFAEETAKKGCSVKLLCGTAVRNWYVASLSTPGIELTTATEDGSAGHHGMVTDLLADYIDWADQLFACGPLPMYRTMAQIPELADRPVQVSLEVMMGCGRGLCYGCTIKTRQGLKKVCQDGPVFDLRDIIWDELNPVVNKG